MRQILCIYMLASGSLDVNILICSKLQIQLCPDSLQQQLHFQKSLPSQPDCSLEVSKMHSLEDFSCLGIDVVQLFVTNLLKMLTQAVHSLVTRDEPHTTLGTTTKPSVRSAELLSLFVNGLFCYILDHQLWYAKLVSSLTLATGANTHLRCLQICSSCDWCFLSTICVSFTQKCFATEIHQQMYTCMRNQIYLQEFW